MSAIGYRGALGQRKRRNTSTLERMAAHERKSKFRKTLETISSKIANIKSDRGSVSPYQRRKVHDFRKVYRANKVVKDLEDMSKSPRSLSPLLVSITF